eukprot:scaffold6395_cov159-Amphora_coffeaeformis.AAC.5
MDTSDPASTNNNEEKDVEMADLSLLEQTQKLIYAEKRLTKLLNETEPWLPTAVAHPHRRRTRPIPSTMDQVESILALARKYASQTSAPAGWNPNAPVVGFSTPSPLPNQLRAGCLATLQLERAQAENKRKREQAVAKARQEQQQQAAKEEAAANEATTSSSRSADEPDPKRREVHRHDKQAQRPTVRTTTPAAKKPEQDEDWNLDASDDDDSDSD